MTKLMNIRYYVGVALLLWASAAHADLVETLKAGKKLLSSEAGQKIFATLAEEKEEQRTVLVQEKAELQQAEKQFVHLLDRHLAEVKHHLALVKSELQTDPTSDYYNAKFSLLNERYQALKDMQQVRGQ